MRYWHVYIKTSILTRSFSLRGAISSTCVFRDSFSAEREERSSASADLDRSNVPTKVYADRDQSEEIQNYLRTTSIAIST